MSDTESRLKEHSDLCIKNYQAWCGNQKDQKTRETLMDALHELRKAVSRVEIEIASTERETGSNKPLPIPPHRSSSKSSGGSNESILPGDDGHSGHDRPAPRKNNGGRRQRPRKAASGGSE